MRSTNRKCAGHLTLSAAAMLGVSLLIAVCAASSQNATPSNDSKAQNKCGGIRDSRDWPNPIISVNAKSVVVTLHGSSEPRQEMPLNHLAAYLKQLPRNAWPCGKVVIASEAGLRGLDDGPAIKENCSKLNEILKGLGVKVDWWPSA